MSCYKGKYAGKFFCTIALPFSVLSIYHIESETPIFIWFLKLFWCLFFVLSVCYLSDLEIFLRCNLLLFVKWSSISDLGFDTVLIYKRSAIFMFSIRIIYVVVCRGISLLDELAISELSVKLLIYYFHLFRSLLCVLIVILKSIYVSWL